MGLRCADSSFDILQRAAHHLRCHRVNLTTLQGRILEFVRPRASSRFVGNGEFFSKMACVANGARVSYASPSVLFVTIIQICERLIRNAYVFSQKNLTTLNLVVRRINNDINCQRLSRRLLEKLRAVIFKKLHCFQNKSGICLIHSP